jgi:hemerythrin-like domain-containing protein
VRAGLIQVRSNGPLFRLRANCVQRCHAVRSHHEGEDAGLFQTVRRSAPDLRATVDQLQAEHRVVSDLLDQVEGAARGLENSLGSRTRLADALHTLSVRLLAHLDFEEKVLVPALLAVNPGW